MFQSGNRNCVSQLVEIDKSIEDVQQMIKDSENAIINKEQEIKRLAILDGK